MHVNKRAISIICILAGTILSASGANLPNIVLLVSDDLGRLETTVYGSKEVRTPTL